MSVSTSAETKTRDSRHAQILLAAKKLFYMNGYDGTSMESIATAAGISKGLIYHYFKNKEELLLSFSGEMNTYMSELEQEDNPLEALRRFGRDFLVNDVHLFEQAPPTQILLTTFAEHSHEFAKYADENPILKDVGKKYLSAFFQRGIDSGIFRDGSAQTFGDIFWSYLMGKLLPVKKGNESADPLSYVDEILYLFRRD